MVRLLRPLPVAALVAVLAGGLTHELLVADPLLAVGLGAVYAGWTYFLVAYPATVTAAAPTFEDRRDRLGASLGLFGAAVLPTAVADVAAGGLALPAYAGYVGVVGFLVTVRGVDRTTGD